MKKMIEDLSTQKTKCEFIDWPEPIKKLKIIHWDNPNSIKFKLHKLLGHDIYCEDTMKGWLSQELAKKYNEQLIRYLYLSSYKNNKIDYDIIFLGSDESFTKTPFLFKIKFEKWLY